MTETDEVMLNALHSASCGLLWSALSMGESFLFYDEDLEERAHRSDRWDDVANELAKWSLEQQLTYLPHHFYPELPGDALLSQWRLLLTRAVRSAVDEYGQLDKVMWLYFFYCAALAATVAEFDRIMREAPLRAVGHFAVYEPFADKLHQLLTLLRDEQPELPAATEVERQAVRTKLAHSGRAAVDAWKRTALSTTQLYTGNRSLPAARSILGPGEQPLAEVLRSPDLTGANLEEALLDGVELPGREMARANLRGAHLYAANLEGANLAGANLEEAFLGAANLTKAALQRADLRRSYVVEANLDRAVLDGARLDEAYISHTPLRDASLVGMSLEMAHLHDVDMTGSNLSGANWDQVKAYGTRLVLAELAGARLEKADFIRGDLREANLNGSEMQHGGFFGADFRGASLRAANLRGADLRDAEMAGADLSGALFDEETMLPDGAPWRDGSDLARFTDPSHPGFWVRSR